MQTLLVLFLGCLTLLIFRELRIDNPLINFRTLADRNFHSCAIITFCAFGVLYANTTSLPGLLQSLFGYDATTSELVLSPAGLFAIVVPQEGIGCWVIAPGTVGSGGVKTTGTGERTQARPDGQRIGCGILGKLTAITSEIKAAAMM